MDETQILKLKDWITDTYGTPEALGHYLDLAVEMLFYLEKDAFEQIEVQDVVTTLQGMKRIFR